MSPRPWIPLLSFLLLACAGCELGPKLACNADGDCFDGLTCVEGLCHQCTADRAGCACIEGSCLGGLVCGAGSTCAPCSPDAPCTTGLACDRGRCVGCSSDFAGCPCDAGQCGTDLRCNEANQCEALACTDGARNGDETDVDCGGSCEPCAEESRCLSAADCESLACDREACLAVGSCLVRTNEYPTIQWAVDDTRCTRVLLEEGLFDERVRVDRAIEIIGVPGYEALGGGTVLSSTGFGPTIEITQGTGTVHLRHLQIRDSSALRGAGVLSRRDLVVEDSLFIGNRAHLNAVSEEEEAHPCGGAIFVEDTNLAVRDSIFLENQAEETRFTGLGINVEAAGGAICLLGKGELLVESSEFSRNLATTTSDMPPGFSPQGQGDLDSLAFGGAIAHVRKPLTSSADRHHGGLDTIRDSTFKRNIARASIVGRAGEYRLAKSSGGAIHSELETVLERSIFFENVSHANAAGTGFSTAHAWGGGATLEGGGRIKDATFEHNWALPEHSVSTRASGGGAVLFNGSVESTRFYRNRVDAGDGGALSAGGQSTISNSVFWDNYGLGSSAIAGTGRISNSTLIENGPGPQLAAAPLGAFTLRHSVVASGHGSCNVGRIFSDGYNLFKDDGCLAPPPPPIESDRIVSAMLVETVFNRSTGERASSKFWHNDAEIFSEPGFPLIGSPLIDGGDSNGCRDADENAITVDIRGVERTGPCDIGAFAFDFEQPSRPPLRAFLLRQAALRAPDLFAPGDESCATSVTQDLTGLINQSITGDNDRPPDQGCDGLIDAPLILILEAAEAESTAHSVLMPTRCVATHVACADPFIPYRSWGEGTYRVLAEEPCSIGEAGAVVAPGPDGCIAVDIRERVEFDVGIRFEFSHAELIGELEAASDRISSGVLRGFLPDWQANQLSIPSSMQSALGGPIVLSDLLCGAELEEQGHQAGYFFEFDVEFEAVTLYGQGLPPIRPRDCE